MHNLKRKIFPAAPLLIILFFLVSLKFPIPQKRLNPSPIISLRIMDRDNVLLREVLSDEEGHCQWTELENIAPELIQATIVVEDRRFFRHTGINFFSIARASLQNMRAGRVVSGASTITQQLVRNIYHFERNLFSKVCETWLALRMESTLTKKEILSQYLNRICYGNSAYGIEAASRLYFDKPASQLSLAESAFLAGLPRSPSSLNPFHTLGAAVQRQRSILFQMFDLGLVSSSKLQRSLEESLQLSAAKNRFRAPHFCDYVLSQLTSSNRRRDLSLIKTTCDSSLQEKVETLVKNHIDTLAPKGITNGAVVVLHNRTGEILCLVGSKDFFDSRIDGQVNGALSLRQPGSTLKPFTYGLALENGWTAADIIQDGPVQYPTPGGPYSPRNYDKKYHGLIRLREALACSYNIPAVSLLEALGTENLLLQLKEMGFESLDRGPDHYGLGLTLGNGEVTLLELVQAYSALARGGSWLRHKSILQVYDSDLSLQIENDDSAPRSIFPPQITHILTDILSDRDARIPSFGYNSSLALPFPCAVKTGTSKDFRDNWTIGYTPNFTVGIWVGNFDGSPMHNVSGVTGCGPLFRDIMLVLENGQAAADFLEVEGLIRVDICPLSGQLASENCPGSMKEIFIAGTEPQNFCSLHQQANRPASPQVHIGSIGSSSNPLTITFPRDGDLFRIDPVLKDSFQSLFFRVNFSVNVQIDKLEWWVNGKREAVTTTPFDYSWKLKQGKYTIVAVARIDDTLFESRSVTIQVWP
jgi:penicillin-binding protein 1C